MPSAEYIRPLPRDRDQSDLPEEIPQADIDLYEVAEFIYMARVEHLQQTGQLRRTSEITTEEELDHHFDDLSWLYRQVCRELGLDWPSPAIDTSEDDN